MSQPVKNKRKGNAKKPRPTAAASSKRRGLSVADPVSSASAAGATELVKSIPIAWIIKFGFIVGLALFIWYKYKNRFIPMKFRGDLDPSNISDGEAQARAEAIYNSIGWFSNSFATVADNVANLNYNGFVKLYNAFGHHTGTLLGGELDLVGWCKNQFTEYEVSQLRMLTGGAFF